MVNKLLSGAAVRIVALFLNIAVSFVMLPLMINHFDHDIYAIWVIISSIMIFLNVFDLGLSSSTQRYIATELENPNHDEKLKTLNCSLLVYVFLSIMVVLVCVGIIIFADNFVEQAQYSQIFRQVFSIIAIAIFFNFLALPFKSILYANLRYDITGMIEIAGSLTRAGCFYFLITHNYGLKELSLVTLGVQILATAAIYLACKRGNRWMKISRHYLNKERFRNLFSFSLNTLMITALARLRFNVDYFLISSFIALSSVTIYTVGAKLSEYYLMAISSLLGTTMPYFSRLLAKLNNEEIKKRLFTTLKVSCILSFLGAGFIILIGKEFIVFWVGDGFSEAYPVLVALLIGFAVSSSKTPEYSYLMANAKHAIQAKLSAVDLIAHIVISFALYPSLGLLGVALGCSLPIVVTKAIILPVYISKMLNTSVLSYNSFYFKLAIPLILIQLPIAWLVKNQLMDVNFKLKLPLVIAMYLVIFIISCLTIFNRNEKQVLKDALKKKKKTDN